jgi:hypothetical protein
VAQKRDGVADPAVARTVGQRLMERSLPADRQRRAGKALAQGRDRVEGVRRSLPLDEAADEQYNGPIVVDSVAPRPVRCESVRIDAVGNDCNRRIDSELANTFAVLVCVTEDHVCLVERPPARGPEVEVKQPLGGVLTV